jgi:hypothetical protein
MDATELLQQLKAVSDAGSPELLQTARLAALGSGAVNDVREKELFGLVILLVQTIMEERFSAARVVKFGCECGGRERRNSCQKEHEIV